MSTTVTTATEPVLLLQSSPHIRQRESVKGVMYTVVIALLPAAAAAVVIFGLSALAVMITAVVGCLVFEALALRISGKKLAPSILDGSAVITGLLLAMNLPSEIPVWIVLVGSLVAIALGKHVYGGLGNNPFNPALVARVFLLISFPTAMTSWPVTRFTHEPPDVVTGATPLGVLKMSGPQAAYEHATYWDLFIGNVGGSLGEVSAAALIIGGLILLVRRVITWEIPVSFMGAVALFMAVAWFIDPNGQADPLFHILSGGVMLGAWFMATDMVTSPVTREGMLIFGVGCGVLTCIIRLFAGYPEGVSFAILIMNGFVPLIDRYVKPRPFGEPSTE